MNEVGIKLAERIYELGEFMRYDCCGSPPRLHYPPDMTKHHYTQSINHGNQCNDIQLGHVYYLSYISKLRASSLPPHEIHV